MTWRYTHKKHLGKTIVRNREIVCDAHILDKTILGCRYIVTKTDSRSGRCITVNGKDVWISGNLFKKYFWNL